MVNKILITRLGRVYSNKSDQIHVKSFMVPSEYGAGPWESRFVSSQFIIATPIILHVILETKNSSKPFWAGWGEEGIVFT